jgi:signal transduction histidine kinase
MLNEIRLPSQMAPGMAGDIVTLGTLGAIPILLQVLCDSTGMGFAVLACATGSGWTAGAVEDRIGLGVRCGDEFNIEAAPKHCFVLRHGAEQQTPLARYLWVPILLAEGRYLGNLCVVDPRPANPTPPWILSMLQSFARLIAQEFDGAKNRARDQTALLDERSAGELREQFIAILGHDLRNPLQAIVAIGELLEIRLDDPALNRVASRIRTNARRMFSLIDDVLDFARGRLGGGIDLQLEHVDDVEGALLSVVQELQDAKPDRTVTHSIDVKHSIHCDVGRLQQVVSNLLANALCHGAAKTPVRFTAEADDAYLTLEVWNDGEPIPPTSLGKIFSPFWRHTVSKDRGGLGLGLHICAQIVRAHGGQITVVSERSSGTKFTARVPLGISNHQAAADGDRKRVSPQVASISFG